MNREIKFRAWDKENNCFWKNIYEAYRGNLKELNIGLDGRIHMRTIDGTTDESMFSKRFELMQFTGLKDKNGVEIYEGDILKSFEQIGEVVYDIGMYKVIWKKGNPKDYDSFLQACNMCEVIGNVYENKNLLEVKDNE